MAGLQMTVIVRRTENGGWEGTGALGAPGAAHAREVTEGFHTLPFDQASYLVGVAAATMDMDLDAVRGFAALTPVEGEG